MHKVCQTTNNSSSASFFFPPEESESTCAAYIPLTVKPKSLLVSYVMLGLNHLGGGQRAPAFVIACSVRGSFTPQLQMFNGFSKNPLLLLAHHETKSHSRSPLVAPQRWFWIALLKCLIIPQFQEAVRVNRPQLVAPDDWHWKTPNKT